MKRTALTLLSLALLGTASSFAQQQTAIQSAITKDASSFYFTDFKNYPQERKSLPIGVFDSGTGGLTVLDAIVAFNEHINGSGKKGKDSLPDFQREDFLYLADQANMPYGNYYATNKTDLLQEHIIKDFQFLLNNRYYADALAAQPAKDKKQVKAIVVACNTATAYGYKQAVDFIKQVGVEVPVIGVINAGVRGALAQFKKPESGSIGVFATVGTIASQGYERTIREQLKEQGYSGNIQIVNAGGYGLAEAIDGEQDYIQHGASKPRNNYRGPSLNNADYPIEREMLKIYNFNFSQGQMLCDNSNADDCQLLQLNSPENYIRYHLVSLLNNLKKSPNPQPLKALILGCTHYPYMVKEIQQVIAELRAYKDPITKSRPYEKLLAPQVNLIDPSIYVARELYQVLQQGDLLNTQGDMLGHSEFYISVPNKHNPNVQLDEQGRFTYDYKYGRQAGELQEYIKTVPFTRENIPAETIDRFKELIPKTYQLIQNFGKENPKMKDIPAAAKIR